MNCSEDKRWPSSIKVSPDQVLLSVYQATRYRHADRRSYRNRGKMEVRKLHIAEQEVLKARMTFLGN